LWLTDGTITDYITRGDFTRIACWQASAALIAPLRLILLKDDQYTVVIWFFRSISLLFTWLSPRLWHCISGCQFAGYRTRFICVSIEQPKTIRLGYRRPYLLRCLFYAINHRVCCRPGFLEGWCVCHGQQWFFVWLLVLYYFPVSQVCLALFMKTTAYLHRPRSLQIIYDNIWSFIVLAMVYTAHAWNSLTLPFDSTITTLLGFVLSISGHTHLSLGKIVRSAPFYQLSHRLCPLFGGILLLGRSGWWQKSSLLWFKFKPSRWIYGMPVLFAQVLSFTPFLFWCWFLVEGTSALLLRSFKLRANRAYFC